MKKYLLGAILACVMTFGLHAQNIPNPVLPRVADAGVMKFNGKYYIGGVGTYGSFYVSDDLIKWDGPVKVLTMDNDWVRGWGFGDDQIHANDVQYINGKFHMFWSVNYWGKDKHVVHIGHADADSPLGPFTEPSKENWVDNRIDAHMFRDDDGKLYFYMVKFTDGNTIWARPMKDPYTFAGDPICQFSSLPDTWETMDNRVAEGPWVIKYRGRYYMMYNANHTGTSWGNYQLGVAEASSPMGFQHGNKYPYPLLGSNQTGVEENHTDLLVDPVKYEKMFNYTFDDPGQGWEKPAYDASAWKLGEAGFAASEVEGSTVRHFGTEWKTDNIFLRNKFNVYKNNIGNLALRVTHTGDTEIFLNGRRIYSGQGNDYRMVNLDKEALSALADGSNLLAVHSKSGRGAFIDVSLFDMKGGRADDILFTPGQPNILRGPNGFEWWLIYMANKNAESRGQHVNRIHFFDKTMYADGVTSVNTPGYFPAPTKPTYGDDFDNASHLGNSWALQGGNLKIDGGELKAENTTACLESKYQATQYLYETGVNASAEAGIVAFFKDDANWVKVGIRQQDNKWYIKISENGQLQERAQQLLADFRFGVYHCLKVLRDGARFEMFIDNIPAPGENTFNLPFSGKGVPGVFASQGPAAFDGIIYTIGWDEYDNNIAGWKAVEGDFQVSQDGLRVRGGDSFRAFKGDPLGQYEFSLQLYNEALTGEAGIYPLYIDDKNYVKAGADFASRELHVTAYRNGKKEFEKRVPLGGVKTMYADIKTSDMVEKGYTFESPSQIGAIMLPRTPAGGGRAIENMFERVSVEYLHEGKWYAPQNQQAAPSDHPGYTSMTFTPFRTEALRFINKTATDLGHNIYKIRVDEQVKESYNLRAVKLGDQVLIFVDGVEAVRIPASYGDSQPGIFSQGCAPRFNGILRYDLPR